MREVVRAVTLLGMEELVAELGGNFRSLAEEVGLDASVLHHPHHLLPARKAHELTNLAAERLKRKDFGLVWGARSDPSRLGPLHVALTHAKTGRQAIELVARYLQVHFPTGAIILDARKGRKQVFIGLRSLLRRPPPLEQFYERRVASLHVILKLVCGPDYQPDEVWFSHDQHSAIAAYRRVFGVKPSFNMPANGIVLSQALLDAVRPGANDQVREMAIAYLNSHHRPEASSLAAEAFHMTNVLLRTSNCEAPDLARALGMHVRTLQRRLREEGATFGKMKDDVRRAMAEKLLADPAVSLTDAAFSLHYANLSAFTRSCRRWFGAPPRIARRSFVRKGGIPALSRQAG